MFYVNAHVFQCPSQTLETKCAPIEGTLLFWLYSGYEIGHWSSVIIAEPCKHKSYKC